MAYLLFKADRQNRIARKEIKRRDEERSNSIEVMKAHMLDSPLNNKKLSRDSIIKMYKERLEKCKEQFCATQAYSNMSSKHLNNNYSFSVEERDSIIDQISESFIDTILDMNIEIENLAREDIIICLLSSMGFNIRFISTFINISESGVRKRKVRLVEKTDKEFIELFI